MTTYVRPTERPDAGKFSGFHHVRFYVSNAKQACDFYCTRFGFKRIAYQGLETKEREVATHVCQQGDIILAFSCSLNPKLTPLSKQVALKGDYVKDVAFGVEDCKKTYAKAVEKGAKSISPPKVLTDENGSVTVASVATYGDCIHTFVQSDGYTGRFLPGYKDVDEVDPLTASAPEGGLLRIDHVVGNQPDAHMTKVASWYENMLGFHRFWSVDDDQMHTEYSALRSIVVADFDEKIKMPINEPADGIRISQIQEYVDYHGEGGVQHVALATTDIIQTVRNLKARGLKFLTIPDTYYEDLKERLDKSPVTVAEDLKVLQELAILVDFDDKGYLLQLFTKPLQDRPTLFFEVIERHNHSGFGAGNFKALFEAIERDQENRGNLYAKGKAEAAASSSSSAADVSAPAAKRVKTD